MDGKRLKVEVKCFVMEQGKMQWVERRFDVGDEVEEEMGEEEFRSPFVIQKEKGEFYVTVNTVGTGEEMESTSSMMNYSYIKQRIANNI